MTVIDAVIAFPVALYMAKVASPRAQRLLVIAILTPLWASYLVKAYAWRGMFSASGPIAWLLEPFGISSPGYGLFATVVTLAYLWLPYMILPMYAGLERLPNSLLEASADLGAGSAVTMRRVVLPVLFPAMVAGSIFAFSLTLGDYIAVQIVGGANQMLGNVDLRQRAEGQQPAVRRGGGDHPRRDHARLPGCRPPHRSAGEPMNLSTLMRRVLAISTGLALLFVYAPLALVVLNSFNTSRTFAWPPTGYTTEWWKAAFQSQGARDAVWVSVQVALVATLVALVLGTMAALALQRFRFFGRDTVSLLIILPIALPGVVTGVALANFFTTMVGSSWASSRSSSPTRRSASSPCSTTRSHGCDGSAATSRRPRWTSAPAPSATFYKITLPMLRSSLLAGGLLAFALSFDEIIVTTFTVGQGIQTLPIWIYQNLFRPNQAPVVNVVAAVLIVVSVVPIWIAQKLAGTDESVAAAR